MCVYTFQHSTATVDWGSGGLYNTPDLWYVVGTIGHTITWEEIRFTPSAYPLGQCGKPESSVVLSGEFGLQYALHQDGYLIEDWQWSGILKIGVDGLDVGDHVFELGLQSVPPISDMVTVHVVQTPEDLPPGVFTDSVGPMTDREAGLDLWVPVIVIGLSSVAVIILWKKRKT